MPHLDPRITGIPTLSDFGAEWRRWFPQWPDTAATVDLAQADTFAAALAELVHTLQQEGLNDDAHALTMITQGAVGMIAGAEQAGIVVPAGPGRLEERAAAGALAPLVLKVQNDTGEGPCLDAVHQSTQILVADLPQDDRWPAFRDAATAWEVRSMLCTPMRVHHTTVGSLTLLSTRPFAFGEAAANLAAVFAAHATLALTSLEHIRNLQAMASTRLLIGQAQGVLMHRHRINADDAFQMLVTTSQHDNVKLRVLCQQLLDETPQR